MHEFLKIPLAFLKMAWDIYWGLAFGFMLSSLVRAFVSTERISARLGKNSVAAVAMSSFFGAISSSCSYAAASMSRTLLIKGATWSNAVVFMVASTNLVFEIFIVIVTLLGWPFFGGELAGGLLFIIISAVVIARVYPAKVKREAVEHAGEEEGQGMQGGTSGHGMHSHGDKGGEPVMQGRNGGDGGDDVQGEHGAHSHGMQGGGGQGMQGGGGHVHDHGGMAAPAAGMKAKLQAAAGYFYMDVMMVGKDILIGVAIASVLMVLVPDAFWKGLFLTGGRGVPHILVLAWNDLAGILIAIFAFVCSVGNIVMAAVLWKGGISFGGVIAFILADLVTVPMLMVYRTYYGSRTMWSLLLTLAGCIFFSALAVDLLFGALHWIPGAGSGGMQVMGRPFRWDWQAWLNVVFIPLSLIYFFYGRPKRR